MTLYPPLIYDHGRQNKKEIRKNADMGISKKMYKMQENVLYRL